jgi:hypothetical protein
MSSFSSPHMNQWIADDVCSVSACKDIGHQYFITLRISQTQTAAQEHEQVVQIRERQ